MGTDIHTCVEVRREDGEWKAYLRPMVEGGFVWPEGSEDQPRLVWLDVDRDYTLFAFLAGVRNGYGFAGVDTGDPIRPIADPRGLPEDVSFEVASEHASWGLDAHSASWLTVKELLEADWDQEVVHRGVVSRREYMVFKKQGKPETWSGGVSGASVRMLTNVEMDEVLATEGYDDAAAMNDDDLGFRDGRFTRVQWASTLREDIGDFLEDVKAHLVPLGDPSTVRIVFWFDS